MPDVETAAPPDPPRRRKPTWRKRIGCGCAAGLLALVVGSIGLEGVLRANSAHFLGAPAASHGMYQAGDGRSYGLTPGWRGEQTIDGRTTGISINAHGRRGVEPEVVDAPGVVRVLVLGDSLVFGHGVADDETIPARLEHHLAAALGVRVVVGNCGVAGHGTRDQPIVLARHQGFDPDLVVSCTYLGNDFVDDCRQTSATVEGYLLHGAMARAARESTRFRWTMRLRSLYLLELFLVRYAPGLAYDRSQLENTPEEIEAFADFPPESQRFAGLFFDRLETNSLVRKVTDRCRENYRSLHRVAGPVPVVQVILPTWWHLDPEVWRAAIVRQELDPEDFELGLSQKRLLDLAAAEGWSLVDLTPRLAAARDRDALWLPEDRHLSAAGCDQVARWLVPTVRQSLGR